MPITAASWVAPIACWSVWEAGVSADGVRASPDLGFVEPMLRRRLSSLARMTLRVAHDCAHDRPDARFVYASRHGELRPTTTMLEALAAGEGLSPALFSMSVLNASGGLFSMLQKNTAPATAISAGPASFAYGLLEACLQLAENPAQPVLYVYADEPAPEVYGKVDLAHSDAHALALLLDSSATTRLRASRAAAVAASCEAPSRAFLRALQVGQGDWGDGQSGWSWTRESS